jgi:uncharacterized protein (DUF4415 family)
MSGKRTTRGSGVKGGKDSESTRTVVFRPGRGRSTKGYIDLARVLATTEEEIEAQAIEDGDVWTPEMFARAKVFRPRKQSVTMRLDPDVLAFFQRGGRGYQSRINAVLRAYMTARPR